MAEPLLALDRVSVFYGKAMALAGVSMEVGKGEVVALIGSNGAGKTTTLRTISGLLTPASGEVRFRGRRINGVPPHEIVSMGIAHVPEGRRVFSDMTVRENLELGAYRRKDKAEVERDLSAIYESFPVLSERRRQQAGSLSGGEQQMLATARALMTAPDLVLLDEPSLGLSPIMVREVGKIVRRINGQGVTVVLIEQNARMALRLAHRAYILELGRIVMAGTGRELAADEGVKRSYLGEKAILDS